MNTEPAHPCVCEHRISTDGESDILRASPTAKSGLKLSRNHSMIVAWGIFDETPWRGTEMCTQGG